MNVNSNGEKKQIFGAVKSRERTPVIEESMAEERESESERENRARSIMEQQ